MKKTIFKNKLFYKLLIAFIIILLIYNGYASIIARNIYGAIPICFGSILLVLIFKKNQYAKIAILIWAIVALIIANGLEVIADLMDVLNDNFKRSQLDSLIYSSIVLAIGILIVDYTRRTVAVISADENPPPQRLLPEDPE